MYPTSQEYKNAIASKAEQRMFLFYPDAYIGYENIALDGGIELTEIINPDEDYNIGKSVMSSMTVRLVNTGLPSEIFTEEFKAKFAVKTHSSNENVATSYIARNVVVRNGDNYKYYIRDSGGTRTLYYAITPSVYSSKTVSSDAYVFVVYFDTIYVLNSSGSVTNVFTFENEKLNELTDYVVPESILPILSRCSRESISLHVNGTEYCESKTGEVVSGLLEFYHKQFELIPLGVFKPERPKKVNSRYVDIQAYDRMRLFEKSAFDYLSEITYPKTIGEIYNEICSRCGVSNTGTGFLHSGKTLAFDTFRNKDVTFREVLAWIAEAACCTARISRDGNVEIVEFSKAVGFDDNIVDNGESVIVTYKDTEIVDNGDAITILFGEGVSLEIDGSSVKVISDQSSEDSVRIRRTQRFTADIAEIPTPAIDKLEVYSSYADVLCEIGTGNNLYQIIDNPFLYAENDGEVDNYARAIYNRLTAFPAYYAITSRVECDPAIQCGDIIMFEDDNGIYRTMPLFAQTITWNGYAKATYEATGAQRRANIPVEQRELANLKKEFLRKSDAYAEIDSYINSQKGEAAIEQVVGGKYVSKVDLEGELEDYIKSTEFEARITTYVNSEEGIAEIKNGLSGTYLTTDDLEGYAKTDDLDEFVTSTQLNTSINQYLNTTEGKASIESAVSGKFVTTDDLEGYVTETDLQTSVTNTINGATGKAAIESVVSGTYLKKSELGDEVEDAVADATKNFATKTYVTNSISQYVGPVEDDVDDIYSEISLTAAYGSGTIGSNVRALLQLVANADSSDISLKADAINLEGYVTFTSLETAGATRINGANIIAGTVSADMVDTSTLKVREIWDTDLAFPICSSQRTSGSTGTVFIGNRSYGITQVKTQVYMYAEQFEIQRTDSTAQNILTINCVSQTIYPSGEETWSIGTEFRYFEKVHALHYHILAPEGTGNTYLYTDGLYLYWVNANEERYTLA